MALTERLQGEWLTPRQVAQRYSISETMLSRLRFQRRGPVFRRVSYKVLLYHSLDIELWLQSRPAGGDSRMRPVQAVKDPKSRKIKIPA